MNTFLTSFWCCIWWFLAGVLLGWLLNRWLCKCSNKNDTAHSNASIQNDNTSTPNKFVDQPAVPPKAPPANQIAPKIKPASATISSTNAQSTNQVIDLASAKKSRVYAKKCGRFNCC